MKRIPVKIFLEGQLILCKIYKIPHYHSNDEKRLEKDEMQEEF